MEDLLNYAVPALVAGFVVLAAGAYVFDKMPESAAGAAVPQPMDDPGGPPAGPGPEGPTISQNSTAADGG
jgi:hypothetical protein